jgi:hypothetical protein
LTESPRAGLIRGGARHAPASDRKEYVVYRVTVTADVETQAEADKLESDLQEAVGKNDGDLQWSEIQDLESGE